MKWERKITDIPLAYHPISSAIIDKEFKVQQFFPRECNASSGLRLQKSLLLLSFICRSSCLYSVSVSDTSWEIVKLCEKLLILLVKEYSVVQHTVLRMILETILGKVSDFADIIIRYYWVSLQTVGIHLQHINNHIFLSLTLSITFSNRSGAL